MLALEADVPWVPGRNSPPDSAYIAVMAHDPVRLRFPIYEFTAQLRALPAIRCRHPCLDGGGAGALGAKDKERIAERSQEARRGKRQAPRRLRGGRARRRRRPRRSIRCGRAISSSNCSTTTASCSTTRSAAIRCSISCAATGPAPTSRARARAAAGRRARLSAPSLPRPTRTSSRSPATASTCSARRDRRCGRARITARRSWWWSTPTAATRPAPPRILHTFGRDSHAAKQGYEGGYFDPPIDFAKEAEAAGAYGENVRDPAELPGAYKRGLDAIRSGKPAVISIWQKRLEGDD